jgi:hypothetical protein
VSTEQREADAPRTYRSSRIRTTTNKEKERRVGVSIRDRINSIHYKATSHVIEPAEGAGGSEAVRLLPAAGRVAEGVLGLRDRVVLRRRVPDSGLD